MRAGGRSNPDAHSHAGSGSPTRTRRRTARRALHSRQHAHLSVSQEVRLQDSESDRPALRPHPRNTACHREYRLQQWSISGLNIVCCIISLKRL